MEERSATLIPIRKTKRSRAPQAGVLAAILILIAAIIWAVLNGKDGRNAEASRPLLADFEAVWAWSDPEYAGGAAGAQWSFRWDGSANLKTAKDFASEMGFKLSGQLDDGNNPVDVVASDPDYKLTLWIHSQRSEDADSPKEPLFDIVLLMDAAGHAERQAVADTIARVERTMTEAGLELRGGFTVKGVPVLEGAGARIVKAASAKEAEAYEDGHTSSLTYYSEALGSRVQSGSKPVNMQIAESPGPAGKGSELIIGVPLITGDYTMQDK